MGWGKGGVRDKMTEKGELAKLLLLSEKLKDLTISAA
jgi:hypothetical protein